MRIISGEFRHRRLLPPLGKVTRPITDRVKESLFNILMPWMDGAHVADLFCGTGSLGLEAISRGASACLFADRDQAAMQRLNQNIDTLGVRERSTVRKGDIVAKLAPWLADSAHRLDVIFLDPPYPMAREWMDDEAAGDRAIEAIFAPAAAALADDGLVVLRTPKDLALPDVLGALELHRRKVYGTMALNFYGHHEPEG